jgi:rhodanese-related sulfurtransferase
VRSPAFVAAVLLALLPSTGSAEPPVIDAQAVRGWMSSKAKAVLVDARLPEEYEQGHIPGAINVPAERMKAEAARLPKDRATPLIFYCRGTGCTLSHAAARAAAELGYGYVMIYQGGFPDWMLRGYPVARGTAPGR